MNRWAFDLATETGWAISGDPTITGTFDLSPRRGDSAGMRFVYLRARLNELLQAFGKPDLVIFEQAHHRGGPATQVGVGLMTHLMSWCCEQGIEYRAVHSATLKKQATGSGRADKDAMCAAASKVAGVAITNDNQADAILLLGVPL